MWSVFGCQLATGLLLMLCIAVPGGVFSHDAAPAAAPAAAAPAPVTGDATLIGTLDQLWAFVDRVERTVTLSVTAEVGARLKGLQARLSGHADEVTRRLDGQAEENSRLSTQVSDLSTRLSTQVSDLSNRLSTQVSDLSNRMSTQSTQLDDVSRRLERLETESGAAQPFPRDCSDLSAGARSGIHLLQPGPGRSQPPVPAYCDLDNDGGGWTVIQRRTDIEPRQNFYLGWAEYKRGFGELDEEFWWGLDHMWSTTSPRDRRYELRIDLWDFEGQTKHAIYQHFRIASEAEGYTLTALNYTGDAGDGLKYHTGMQFTTKDKDRDTHGPTNCAQTHKGAWWYNSCHHSNLNGRYLSGTYSSPAEGVCWRYWRGNNYSMKTTTMKIRPTQKQ